MGRLVRGMGLDVDGNMMLGRGWERGSMPDRAWFRSINTLVFSP